MTHPLRFDEDDPVLRRVRDVCLGMPGASEKVSHGRPNFYTVKVFAIYGATLRGDHHSDALAQSIVVLPDADERPGLLDDERFFVPAHVGPYGWVGLDLRRWRPDWAEVAELVDMSYRNTAPATLVTELDGGAARTAYPQAGARVVPTSRDPGAP